MLKITAIFDDNVRTDTNDQSPTISSNGVHEFAGHLEFILGCIILHIIISMILAANFIIILSSKKLVGSSMPTRLSISTLYLSCSCFLLKRNFFMNIFSFDRQSVILANNEQINLMCSFSMKYPIAIRCMKCC